MANAETRADTLRTAFSAFNHQAGLLEASYRELQDRVSTMSHELALSQTARHKDLLEKERLGNRLVLLLEALPSAVMVIDGNGIIVEHNSKSAELLNMPLLGCAWSVIVQREFCRGKSADGELKLKDGRWFSLARQSLEGECGEILLLTDVTESRGMADMLQRQQRLSCIGEMTARLGHQFRTPLASALLYASQLENPELFDREEVAGKIIGRLQDLAAMMDDMLRYAAGAKNSDETVFVADLFRDVVDAIGPQFDSADQLSIEVENPELTVDVNVTALKGALLNLVSNAIQASGDSPQVELGAVCSRDEVCLTVTDHGDGIDDDLRSRIFEPFFTTRPQGTGLGLAVVRSVAEAHGGEVLVDSGPGGTTFAICIPASSKNPEASPAEAAAEKDDD